jgi:hypothetical protein
MRGFHLLFRALWLAAALVVIVEPAPVRADVYTYVDENGVVHYSNVDKAKKKKGSKRIYKSPRRGPKRPKKGSRKDVVPARDRSKDRFSRYDAYIKGAARLYKIPVPLIRAVIRIESNYDPRVVSCKGAKGLMQMMPGTAKDMGVVNVFDPRENIYGGTRYLRVLANMFNGDLVLTIAAHHAGPGSVKRYRGIPPFKTTQRYVRLVLRWYYKYRLQRLKKLSKRGRGQVYKRFSPVPTPRKRKKARKSDLPGATRTSR